MTYTDIRYGILLSSEQLDSLRDDCQGFHRSEALATFVKMAAIEPMHYEKKNFTAEIGIGQFVVSTVELAMLWGCDRKTAAKVVKMFNEIGILTSVANNRTTIHTIHCLAFWLGKDGDEEKTIKNPHYTRCPVIKSACKTAATERPAVDGGGMKANNKEARIIDNTVSNNESDTAVQPVNSGAIDSGVNGYDRSTDSKALQASGAALGGRVVSTTGFPTSIHGTNTINSMKHGQLATSQPSPISSDSDGNSHTIGNNRPALVNDHTLSNASSRYSDSSIDGRQATAGETSTSHEHGI